MIFERVTDLETCVKKIIPPGGRNELAAPSEKKKSVYPDNATLPEKIVYSLIDMGEFYLALNLMIFLTFKIIFRNYKTKNSKFSYRNSVYLGTEFRK